MRALIALLVLTTPAAAWNFTATPVCTLSHDTPELAVTVTYDPSERAPYSITLRRPDPWPRTETFGLRFEGPAALTIGTGRHRLSPDGRALTVTDTGFGNVLDGLSYNTTATAIAGEVAVPFDLTDAHPAVEAFRACIVLPSA